MAKKRTLEKWLHALRVSFSAAVLVVLALVIRWSTWDQAWQAGAVEGAKRGYLAGRQSCPSGTLQSDLVLEDTFVRY